MATLACLPVNVTRQSRIPNKVCRLTPMDRARASTPPLGQWPAGWQLHTLMVKVLVLERAGEPLSATTTGKRYWVRSFRVKVLLRATIPAVLSIRDSKRERYFSGFFKKWQVPLWTVIYRGNSKTRRKSYEVTQCNLKYKPSSLKGPAACQINFWSVYKSKFGKWVSLWVCL